MTNSIPLISVVGGSTCTDEETQQAYEVGKLLAEHGYGVVCGGLRGVMEAACKGCKEAGGMTVGILPGLDPQKANPYVQVAISTGLHETRNTIVARAGKAVIAIGGEYGTLSEIGFALQTAKKVVGLATWELRKHGEADEGIVIAATPAEAVKLAIS